MNVKALTAWVVLAVYVAVLFALLRPGGLGSAAVAEIGASFAGIVA